MRTGHGGWRQGLVALVLAIGALGRTAGAQSTSHKFTSSADFNSGTLDSINHSDYPDQLQLNASSSSDPFAYIAQPIEGTVLKMDTTTGKQVGRYPSVYLASCPTCPVANNSACDAWSGNWSPSRTAVDPNGNVWVANRGFGSCGLPRIANDGQGSITMIGSVTAGTCIDRNGNGAIDTSNDANGDGIIDRNDPNEYLGQNDECLIKTIAVGPPFAIIRAIALDTDGTIWVGGYTTQYAYHIDPATGQQLGQVKLGNWPYGFVIRGNFLYGTGYSSGWAVRLDKTTSKVKRLWAHWGYGITVDQSGVAWLGGDSGGAFRCDFNNTPDAGQCTWVPVGSNSNRGITVDADGQLWVADNTGSVAKMSSAGVVLGYTPVSGSPYGIAIASDGRILSAGSYGIATIDPGPVGGPPGPVHLTGRIDYPGLSVSNSFAYTYSDMTGFHARNIAEQVGHFAATQDSGAAGSLYRKVSWNTESPQGGPWEGTLSVEVRAADTVAGLATQGYQTVTHGTDVSGLGIRGRFAEVRVTFTRQQNEQNGPVLTDLTLDWSSSVQGPCPTSPSSAPVQTTLSHLGPTASELGAPLALSALLTDASGAPLAGKTLQFALGALVATGVTDASGVARATLTPVMAGSFTLTVSFAGDEGVLGSSATGSISVGRTVTQLRAKGSLLLPVGGSQSVSAVLSTRSGAPIAGRTLTFQLGGASASATTDAAGLASASLAVPAGTPTGDASIAISFAGDETYEPSASTAPVGLYLPTSFVVWGGNPGGLTPGARLNFWGHSWDQQVTGGDYASNASFKGFADTLAAASCCQPQARSTGSPLLDRSCWTSKPGQSFPPSLAPHQRIGVIVATSIVKRGSTIYGNIAARAILDVDPNPAYAPNPGHPGWGTLVAVIEDCAELFPVPAQLVALQSQPATALPGQALTVTLQLSNPSPTPAASVVVSESFSGLSPASAQSSIGSVGAETVKVDFAESALAVPARQPTESSSAYQARLGSVDGQLVTSKATITFTDAFGQPYPPVLTGASTMLQLPRVTVGVTASPCVGPGSKISYLVTVTNIGSAPAASASIVLGFPDGTSASASVASLAPGASSSATLEWTVPAPAPQGPGESVTDYLARLALSDASALLATASVSWTDAIGNAYGPLEQSTSSTQRLPIVAATAPAGAGAYLPGQLQALPFSVQNQGSGNAFQIELGLLSPDGSTSSAPPFDLGGQESTSASVSAKAPAIAPKGIAESDTLYTARLRALDGASLSFAWSLGWHDASGSSHGPTRGSVLGSEVLPILALSLSAPATALPGTALSYQASAANSGRGASTGAALILTLPDGATAARSLAGTAPGQSVQSGVGWTVPALAPIGQSESTAAYLARLGGANGKQLSASASLSWGDAAANQYGPISGQAATSEELPILAVSPQGTISALLPGQSGTMALQVNNTGSALAQQATMAVAGGVPQLFSLAAAQGQLLSFLVAAPAVAPRSSGETDAAYLARLAALDGSAISFAWDLSWTDAAGGSYGPTRGSLAAQQVLPEVNVALSGPASANVGDTIVYALTPNNSGRAAASGLVLTLTLPDGSTSMQSVASLGAGEGSSLSVPFQVPAHYPTGPVTATVSWTWSDAAGSSYGPVTTSFATQVTNPNEPPLVSAGPSQTVTLPESTVTLQGTATDDGLPAGGVLSVQWTKLSGPGAVVFANSTLPVTTASFSDAGLYVLRLTASDSMFSSSAEVTVTVKLPAGPAPTVAISSPADGAEITSPTDIVGSVSNGLWKLELVAGGEESDAAPNTLCSGYTPVQNAKLCSFDPTLLLNGTYAIRLTGMTESGQSSASFAAMVGRNLKVGLFSLSFNDLLVPVAGLPIQLVRTYDSRDKSRGDFGVGWNLGLRNVRVEKSAGLGKPWLQTQIWDFFPSYCLQPTRSLFVTVTFPTGKVYRFAAGTANPCQALYPITDGTLTFSPVAPTVGTLSASDVDFSVQGSMGRVQLVDFSSGAALSPAHFVLTTEEGTKYVIDEKQGVQQMTDRNGNTLTIGPSGVIHSSGKSVTFERDAAGRITKITDPAGAALAYSYDAAGDLASVTDRTGNVTGFTYNDTHGLLTIVDPRGVQATRNVYGTDGRLLSTTDANGKTITYTHNLSARQEVVTDRLGQVTVYEYDVDGNIVQETDALGGVTTRTFDARGNKLTETNPLGQTTTNTYDSLDQLLTTTDPLGHKTSYTYAAFRQVATTTDPLGRVTTNAYDAKGNLVSTTDAAGKTTSYTYSSEGLPLTRTDRNGKVTSFEYDAAGNLTKQTDALGHATSFTYDVSGNRLTRTRTRTTPQGPETLATTWAYDAENRPTVVTYADGSKTKTTYNAIGKPATTVDQLDRTTSYTYEPLGQLATTTYPDGTSESITYDDAGREASRTDRGGRTTSFERDALGRVTKTTFADGATRRSGFDAAGRETSTTDELGSTTTYGFDAAGRQTTVTDPLGHVTTTGYDAAGNATTVTDANGHTITTSYDAVDRPTKVTYADGTFSSTVYDNEGRRVSQTDAAGITTSFGYDAVGRLVQVTDALGGVTKYGYDELGNRTSQTDAKSHTTSFEYDKLGRRTKRTLPLGQTETAIYDAAGNLTRRIDFNGKTTVFSYDSSNRLLSKTPDPSFGAPAVSFTYTPAGKRATMVDGTGTTVYTYDVRDRLLRKATPFGTLTMSYDLGGGRLTLRSEKPDGIAVDYSWDAARRLASVTDRSAGGGVTSYSYDLAGNPVGYTYPNGVRVTLSRDALGRVKKVAALDPNDQPLTSYEYTFGPAGNRLTLTELSGRTVAWSYDSLYRLTEETIAGASVSGTLSYTLDAVGNRLTRTSTVAPIPSTTSTCDANDRLFSDTYDAAGNTTASDGKSYSYDFEDHLATLNGSEVALVYDGDGNLVRRNAGGTSTTYLVDDGNPTGYSQIVEERVGGAVSKAFVFGSQLISQRQRIGGVWTRSFYGLDGHRDVRYLTDATGAITDTYDLDAYGNLLSSTGSTPNGYRYAGERFDPGLGLAYLRARYLDAGKGRFLTIDPAMPFDWDDPRSLHTYLYGQADPVNGFDPTGKSTLVEISFTLYYHVMLSLAVSQLYYAVESLIESARSDPQLTRFGNQRESVEHLAADAAKAAVSHIGIHGVSVTSEPRSQRKWSPRKSTVERYFSVYQTGGNPYHHTVELPRPVTPQDADRFNDLFHPGK